MRNTPMTEEERGERRDQYEAALFSLVYGIPRITPFPTGRRFTYADYALPDFVVEAKGKDDGSK